MPKIVKNNFLGITNLSRYWSMFENFGGKALEVDYLNCLIIPFVDNLPSDKKYL